MIDTHRKWKEAFILPNPTLKCDYLSFFTFERCSYPLYFILDNSVQFTSVECKTFLNKHGVIFILSVTYDAATNGQAERYVQILKEALLQNLIIYK